MRKAFTLVELLVVIAILSILAGLLMPAIAGARRESQKTACLSNERQFGLQLTMYGNDNNQQFPSWRGNSARADRPFSGGPYDGLYGYDSSLSIALLYPDYSDQADLFKCPALDTDLEIVHTGVGGAVLDLDGNPNTMEWRFRVPDEGWPWTQDPDYIIDPRVPARAEPSRAVYADGPDLHAARRFPARSGWDGDEQVFANHPYGANVLFYDGHASYLKFDVVHRGFLTNPEFRETLRIGGRSYRTFLDSDIYEDDGSQVLHADYYYGGAVEENCDYSGDRPQDCDLGNMIFRNDIGSIPNQNYPDYNGPDQDYVGP